MASASVDGGFVCTPASPSPWQCSTMSKGLPSRRAACMCTANAVGAPPMRGLSCACHAWDLEGEASQAVAGPANARTCLREIMLSSLRNVLHSRELTEVSQFAGPIAVDQRDVMLHRLAHHRFHECGGRRFRPD